MKASKAKRYRRSAGPAGSGAGFEKFIAGETGHSSMN